MSVITKRIATLLDALNRHSVDGLAELYTEDVDFSDFGVGALHMDKPAFLKFCTNLFAAAGNFKVTTRSINGTKSFTTWEWNCTFNLNAMMQETANYKEFSIHKAEGQEMKMVGVSVTWWNEEGKIVKNNDYTKVVEKFDDE